MLVSLSHSSCLGRDLVNTIGVKDIREGSGKLPAASPAQPSPAFSSRPPVCPQDIPTLAAAAAESHPGVGYLVTAPIGLHAAVAVSALVKHSIPSERGGGVCVQAW